MAQGLDTLAMGNFACRSASLGCPDCVDVEPGVWWQLQWRNPGALLPWTGAGAQRTFAHGQRAPLPGSRAAAYGLLRDVAGTRLRRVARIPGSKLAVLLQSDAVRKKEKHTMITLQPEPLAVRQLDVDAT